jgi:hypothetical protein
VPFNFKFEVSHIATLGKKAEHLMLGGSLDADQANKLADLFNGVVLAAAVRHRGRGEFFLYGPCPH